MSRKTGDNTCYARPVVVSPRGYLWTISRRERRVRLIHRPSNSRWCANPFWTRVAGIRISPLIIRREPRARMADRRAVGPVGREVHFSSPIFSRSRAHIKYKHYLYNILLSGVNFYTYILFFVGIFIIRK